MQLSDARFHHVGIVTADLTAAVHIYTNQFGYSASTVFSDPIQLADIVLLTKVGSPMVEVIYPSSQESPAKVWLKRTQGGPYHTCYAVEDLNDAIASLCKLDMRLVFGPAAAVAFGGAEIAFLWGAATGLLELVDESALPAAVIGVSAVDTSKSFE